MEIWISIIAALVIGLGAVAWDASACDAKWPQFQHRYGVMSGCMIYVPQKGWMPSENYRVL